MGVESFLGDFQGCWKCLLEMLVQFLLGSLTDTVALHFPATSLLKIRQKCLPSKVDVEAVRFRVKLQVQLEIPPCCHDCMLYKYR